jgi:hypothetical protein
MQIAYSEIQAKYIAGQSTKDADSVKDTVISEDGTYTILPGQLVIKGTAGVELPVAAFTFQNIEGIVNYDSVEATHEITTNVTGFVDEDYMSIHKKGYLAVTLTGTVAKGGKLFFVHTAGGASALHTWRGDLDTDKASAIPAVATEAGVSGDTIEIKFNSDMQIGIS